MPKAFVTGWPVSHSKSPLLHGYWLDHYKVDGSYEAIPVSPDDFKNFLFGLKDRDFAGGNITIPHKEIAFEIIEECDEAAELIGAINTVWFEGDCLRGANTDAYGFSANLDDQAPRWRQGKTALVIGAGGASRAVIFSLIEAGFNQIHIANRTVERAKVLAARFGSKCFAHSLDAVPELLSEAQLLVNTTSLGMTGDKGETSFDLSPLPSGAIVTDIVYTPLQTPILEEASNLGLESVDGLGMLLHQAVPGFEKWFGKRPAVTSGLRNHILDVL